MAYLKKVLDKTDNVKYIVSIMDRSRLEKIKILTADAARGFDMDPLRLREWLSRRFINPAFPSAGRGSKVYLDISNLYQIGIFKFLLDVEGVSRERAAWIVKMFQTNELFDWDMKQPLFLSFYRMTDGFEAARLFSDVVIQNLKLRTREGDVLAYHVINVGEIILQVNNAFSV